MTDSRHGVDEKYHEIYISVGEQTAMEQLVQILCDGTMTAAARIMNGHAPNLMPQVNRIRERQPDYFGVLAGAMKQIMKSNRSSP